MYLSKLELDIQSPSVRQALRDCQDMHRNLMRAFDGNRREVQMLYRLVKRDYGIYVYVQSAAEPQWNRIKDKGCTCIQMQDVSALLDMFQKDSIFRFSVLACPSKKIRRDGGNSRRVIIRKEDKRIEWLERQAERHGFSILEAHESANEERLYGNKNNREFFLSGVPFEGILRITNADVFRHDFPLGIGAEKAYGFGLLMIGKV